jgi:hypothetical protein
MAITATLQKSLPKTVGGYKTMFYDVTLDNSYPTGGWSLSASTLKLNSVVFVVAEPKNGYVFIYDRTNSKLMAYYADYPAASAGPLIQCPNAYSGLNGVTVRIMVIGY